MVRSNIVLVHDLQEAGSHQTRQVADPCHGEGRGGQYQTLGIVQRIGELARADTGHGLEPDGENKKQ
jgi:hypothetical protein